MRDRAIVLAVTSDQHCGSTVGLCPEEGVRLPDGNRFLPSKPQVWLWQSWLDFHREVQTVVSQEGAELVYIFNGDMYEGDHHNTRQIISRDDDVQRYVGDRVFGVVKDLSPSRIFVVRGTETHVKSTEEMRAHWLGAERDKDTRNWSRYHLRVRINGHLVDAQHHGNMGRLPRTERSNMTLWAYNLLDEYAGRGLEPPKLVLRSHLHRYGDSGPDHRKMVPRIIATPSWKLKDAFTHKIAANSIADIGGVIVVFRPGEGPEVRPKLYTPALPTEEEI